MFDRVMNMFLGFNAPLYISAPLYILWRWATKTKADINIIISNSQMYMISSRFYAQEWLENTTEIL